MISAEESGIVFYAACSDPMGRSKVLDESALGQWGPFRWAENTISRSSAWNHTARFQQDQFLALAKIDQELSRE